MAEPRRAKAFTLFIALDDSVTNDFVVNPTIAPGDFQVSVDGGAFGNLATIPDVFPVGGTTVRIRLSVGEMTGDNIQILGVDIAGAQWADILISIDNPIQNSDSIFQSFYNDATVVVGGGGERTITVTDNDLSPLASTQVSADGLTRTKQ